MSDNSANNKRIAKNTAMLYVRMLLMMGVTLYTSRVVLNALGVEDFGIYNVVGGVVAMFSTMNVTLSNAISRFITIELGKGDQKRLNTMFSTSIVMQIMMAIVIALLIETIGLWFLTHKLIIPPDRMMAAKFVLQFSVVSLFVGMISVPYNATIIAHERMGAFAYIGILEAFGKLGIVYFLSISPFDRLITYSILMAVIALIVQMTYGIYCSRHFEECKNVGFAFDKSILKEMFGFAGWNSIGVLSYVLREHGGNILLNMFFGPVINAAKGVAIQVLGAVTKFVTNFMVALDPQITKSYASGDWERVMMLVFQGARLSFYMMLFLSLPILLNTNYILSIWLDIVPEYTVAFVRLSLILAMTYVIGTPMNTTILATGDIRNYQVMDGCITLLNLPISYVLLRIGLFPEVVFIVSIVLGAMSVLLKVVILKNKNIGFSIRRYIAKVVLNIVTVSIVAMVVPCLLLMQMEESLLNFVVVSGVAVISTIFSIYYVGCDSVERGVVNAKFMQFVTKN